MRTGMNEGFTMFDLEIQRIDLQDRIKRLEVDLNAPHEENSQMKGQIIIQIILKRLLEAERNNLRKVIFELESKIEGRFKSDSIGI